MKIKQLKYFLLFILLFDVVFSFLQFYDDPIGGDLIAIVLPYDSYQDVLENPFGFKVFEGGKYNAPNRYFIHKSMQIYFTNVPHFFHSFLHPIDSLYFASALFKIIIQIFLIYILTSYITPRSKISDPNFLGIACLISALFHSNKGYYFSFGIIDTTISYTFFYAFPICVLLFFFYPFYVKLLGYEKNEIWSIAKKINLFLLIIFLAFSGPLIGPVSILVCGLGLFFLFIKGMKKSNQTTFSQKIKDSIKSIHHYYLIYFSIFLLFSFYSFYVGTFNIENPENISLSILYGKLWQGVIYHLTNKLAYPILIFGIILNLYVIKKNKINLYFEKYYSFILFLLLFSLFYILLLPFGGYRDYRPFVLRYDTLIPVSLSFFYIFGTTTYCILKKMEKSKMYILFLISFFIFYAVADPLKGESKKCQVKTFYKIRESKEKIVEVEYHCDILSWVKIEHPLNSKDIIKMLQKWNIVEDEEKTFYQKR